MDLGDNIFDATPETRKLRQQGMQLRHSLKYAQEIEAPGLRRLVEHLQGELSLTRVQLDESLKQEVFLDGQTGVLHLDGDNRIVKINGYALEILGLDETQALGKLLREAGDQSRFGASIFEDVVRYAGSGEGEREWEKEIPTPGGEPRYFRFRGAFVNGTRLIGIHDVTDLRLSESRVKTIIGSYKDGIALVDENGIVRSTNVRFGELFGLNWSQFTHKPFQSAADLLQYHFKRPQEFTAFFEGFRADTRLQGEQIFEMALPSAIFQIYTHPILGDQDRPMGRIWFVTDVSRFKEMEKKLMANAQELEDTVKARTEELSVQNQELIQMRQEIEAELDMAKQVQQGMLPKVLPRLDGYDLAAAYVPTGKVGGDFYDFIRLDENRVFLFMTDVSGHGVSAALVTAMAKMAFDRHVKVGLGVAQILASVNADLCAVIKTEHYLTAFAAILEIDRGRLVYSRVCHPYPVVYRRRTDSLEHLRMRGGSFLGMFEDSSYAEQEMFLEPGDLLFVYTDGVNESFNGREEIYGRNRLDLAILNHASKSAREVVAEVQADRDAFSEGRQNLDDISIFALRRHERLALDSADREGSVI